MKLYFKKHGNDKNAGFDKKSILSKIISEKQEVKANIANIDKLQKSIIKLSGELVHSVFYVAGEFWYSELLYYDEIKNDAQNAEVDQNLKDKCNKLIDSYLKQFEIAEAKIKFYENVLSEYRKLEDRLISVSQKNSNNKNSEQINSIISNHEEVVEQLWDNQIADPKIFLNQERLKLHKEEVDKINSERLSIQKALEHVNTLCNEHDPVNSTADYEVLLKSLTQEIRQPSQNNDNKQK